MQLVPQGTIVLTVKRNNYKRNNCQKQPPGLFFEKIFESNYKSIGQTSNK